MNSPWDKVIGVMATLGLLIGFFGGAMMWVPPFLPQRWLKSWVADVLVVALTLATVISLVLWAQQPGNHDRRAFVAAIASVGGLVVILSLVATTIGWWGGLVYKAPALPLALLTGLRVMFLLSLLLLMYRWIAARRRWLARLTYLLIALSMILMTVRTDERIVRSGALTFGNGYTPWSDMLLAVLFFVLPPILYELFKRHTRAFA